MSMCEKEFKIGCHLSFSGGYEKMGVDALSIDANAFQYFSRNPRGGKAKDFVLPDSERLCEAARANAFAPFLVHAPYTYNPCSADGRLRNFASVSMCEDLDRQAKIAYPSYYNFHPGSHIGQGAEKGISLVSQMLDTVLGHAGGTTVLIETMSGKGSEIGATFSEIEAIFASVADSSALGVCLDTCHVFSAGYDIVNDLDGVLREFDETVGLSRLKAIHLNDSMTPFGAHKDRHEKIGFGQIGLDAIVRIVNHPLLRGLPFYLETPNELDGYAREIQTLRAARVEK